MKARIIAALFTVIGAGLLILSLQISIPFSYDPLGPKPFPVFVSIALIILPLWIIFFAPDKRTDFTIEKRSVKLIFILCIYMAAFEYFGFMVSTTFTCCFIARTVGSNRMQGWLTGLLISIVFYGVFRLMLDAQLPLGKIFGID